ncbi:MAG: hypothetical protein A3F72_00755 [Bacteroidetes bacterium RIFCSPLOWO2_12_FULL_35_15]|nr:MAG: hypothetical protein A3F72_00755 [Bacteroidetes bacterium RIFCSPLOWO2_12_FULL_35_15]
MDQEKINFRQVRDFGETFNVTVKFLRQNFKLFFQSLIFIAGPFILISAIAGAFYQSSAIEISTLGRGSSGNPLAQYGWSFLIFMLSAIVSGIVLIGTTFSFMINYMEKGPNSFSVNDVATKLLQNSGKILSVFFVLTLLSLLIIAVLVGIVIGLTTAVPVLGILFALAFVFGMLILFPPLMWQLSVVYLVKMQEDKGVFESFGRTREVMHGNFWWTWVIVVCSAIAIGIVGFVFTLPQIIYQMILLLSHIKNGGGETPLAFLIVATICTFCSTILYSALYVINAFHYYSLAEAKDGVGLMERINEIGNTPQNNVEQQY